MFTIKKDKKTDYLNNSHFDKINFALSARTSESKLYCMTLAEVKSGWMSSTDGRRIYQWNMTKDGFHDVGDGLYEVIIHTQKKIVIAPSKGPDLRFPKLSDVISPERYHQYFLSDHAESYPQWAFILAGLARKNIAVNPAYLYPIAKAESCWKVWFIEEERPILFTSGTLRAVVVPVENWSIPVYTTYDPEQEEISK